MKHAGQPIVASPAHVKDVARGDPEGQPCRVHDVEAIGEARLEAALLLGRYLVARVPTGDGGDRRALADVERRIGAELERIDRLEKHNDKVQAGDGIAGELRKARKELELLLEKAKATLRALAVDIDEASEQQSPLAVGLSASSDLLQ